MLNTMYGGTKSEMERLIEDANKVKVANGEMADLSIDSFADITEAIHIVQTEMGITGTTAKEASETISGSFNAMKGAWDNFLVALASSDMDLQPLIDNLVTSASTFIENVMPVIIQIIDTMVNLMLEYLPTAIARLSEFLATNLPKIQEFGFEVITTLINALIENLPQILQTGIQLLSSLIEGLAKTLPELIPTMVDAVYLITETLLDNIDLIIDAGIELILALAEGLINALPTLVEKAPVIIQKLFDAIIRNLPKIMQAGVLLIGKLVVGILQAVPQLLQSGATMIQTVKDGIMGVLSTLWTVGKDIVLGLWNGIKNNKAWLLSKIKSWCGSVLNGFKAFFGIHSPSTVMRDQIGKFIPEGFAVGIDANTDSALNSIKKMNSEIMDEMYSLTAKTTPISNVNGTVSQVLSANSVIRVENYNTLELDGEKVYENQQNIRKNKNLQYGFGGAY